MCVYRNCGMATHEMHSVTCTRTQGNCSHAVQRDQSKKITHVMSGCFSHAAKSILGQSWSRVNLKVHKDITPGICTFEAMSSKLSEAGEIWPTLWWHNIMLGWERQAKGKDSSTIRGWGDGGGGGGGGGGGERLRLSCNWILSDSLSKSQETECHAPLMQ